MKKKLTILELSYLCGAYLKARHWVTETVDPNSGQLFSQTQTQYTLVFPRVFTNTFRDLLNEPKVPERLRVRLLNSGIRMEYLCCTTICDILAERTTSTDRTLGLAFAFLSGTFAANEKPVDPGDLLCFPKFMSVS